MKDKIRRLAGMRPSPTDPPGIPLDQYSQHQNQMRQARNVFFERSLYALLASPLVIDFVKAARGEEGMAKDFIDTVIDITLEVANKATKRLADSI